MEDSDKFPLTLAIITSDIFIPSKYMYSFEKTLENPVTTVVILDWVVCGQGRSYMTLGGIVRFLNNLAFRAVRQWPTASMDLLTGVKPNKVLHWNRELKPSLPLQGLWLVGYKHYWEGGHFGEVAALVQGEQRTTVSPLHREDQRFLPDDANSLWSLGAELPYTMPPFKIWFKGYVFLTLCLRVDFPSSQWIRK